MIADSAQSYIEHGHNAVAERFMAMERHRTEELLALGFSSTMSCTGGANNSAGDPSCVAPGGFNMFEIGSAHLTRVLQLGAKFIF